MEIIGKDTSADYLFNQLQQRHIPVIKVALADQLKKICQRLIQLFYGIEIPLQEFYQMDDKERIHPELPLFAGQPFKLRTVLQLIGTDIFREMLFSSIWCQYLMEHQGAARPGQSPQVPTNGGAMIMIVSDIRMPDEANYFQQHGHFRCYRIVRQSRIPLTMVNQQHSSEQSIQQVPVTSEIDNNGSLEDLYHQLDQVIQGGTASSLAPLS
jgi:hypothetical protein